jgi:hypothetical protein
MNRKVSPIANNDGAGILKSDMAISVIAEKTGVSVYYVRKVVRGEPRDKFKFPKKPKSTFCKHCGRVVEPAYVQKVGWVLCLAEYLEKKFQEKD